MSVMILTVNGQPHAMPDGATLHDLVARFAPNPALVVTELNGTIIAAAARQGQPVRDKDTIELVAFMGGG